MVRSQESIMIIKSLHVRILDTNRVLIWRLILEDYGPDIEYIKGDNNIIPDELSRLPLNGNQYTT